MPRSGKALTRLLADIQPLRESPAFRRLWIGSGVSNVGAWMASFAIGLQIWDLTHSSLAVGALGVVQAVPAVLAGMLGGSVSDAMDRRVLVLITSSSLAVISGIFALQAFLNLRELFLLYVLAVQVSLLVGPAVGGLLTAVGGLKFCYLVDAVSFGAALYGIARLPALPPQREGQKPGLAAAVEGFRFIRSQPVLLAAFTLDFGAMALGMPRALFPALNAGHFGGHPETPGFITAATAAGGLLGSVLSGRLSGVPRKGRAMIITVSLWGACIAVFGFTRVLWLAILALVAAGVLDVASVIFRGTIVQVITPESFRGRVTSSDYIIGSTGPQLGNFEAGIVATLTTPAISAISGGLATTLLGVLARLVAPAFADYTAEATPGEAAGDHAEPAAAS
jgi:MFS family permease